jgi:hypothetical protein
MSTRKKPEKTTLTFLFRHDRRAAQGEYHVQADIYLVELPAPGEELPTIAINDTANTFFITGIAWLLCH